MKHLFKISILLVVALLAFSSCGDEPDGKWAKMKWKNVDNLAKVDNVYVIPEGGGTFTFECTNYKAPWISTIMENGVDEYSLVEINNDFRKFTGNWFEVECINADLVVTIDPLEADCYDRSLTVVVTAGDIFDTFVFQQQKGQ